VPQGQKDSGTCTMGYSHVGRAAANYVLQQWSYSAMMILSVNISSTLLHFKVGIEHGLKLPTNIAITHTLHALLMRGLGYDTFNSYLLITSLTFVCTVRRGAGQKANQGKARQGAKQRTTR
jgi:hypothetical protein